MCGIRHTDMSNVWSPVLSVGEGEEETDWKGVKEMLYFFFKLIFILYWNLVGFQCCVSFRGTAKRFIYKCF